MRRTDNDPLQSYDGDDVNLDGVTDENGKDGDNDDAAGGGEVFDDPFEGDGEGEDGSTFKNVPNKSTAGRVKWQERHKRGKFSKTYQKKQKNQLGF